MTLLNYTSTVAERLMRYVQIDTQSDPFSKTFPSTEKQKDLSRLLVKELQELGVDNAELDENGYVYAFLPSNVEAEVPTVCFCAHVDTSPDSSGTDVKPILHKNWDGSDIVLPDDPSIIISQKNHPYLKERIGDDIITASGKTLLGADDKAGVAVIMDLVQYLQEHPEIKHGRISILFTPDEEIGQGVDKVNMEKVNADFGYTLDGGPRAYLEGENFSANSATIVFEGVSAHPGYAKGKLVNAIKIAASFIDSLPQDSLSPETTEGYEGFVHPVHFEGGAEQTTVRFILRDFNEKALDEQAKLLDELAQQAVAKYAGAQYTMTVSEQYRNMKEVLDAHPHVMEIADKAYQAAGLETKKVNIRGGTDGARLSFMGLPCPNIFTGEMGIHSRQEYCSVQDMEKATEVCVHIAQIVAQPSH